MEFKRAHIDKIPIHDRRDHIELGMIKTLVDVVHMFLYRDRERTSIYIQKLIKSCFK